MDLRCPLGRAGQDLDFVRREVLTARLSSLSPQGADTLKMELRDTLNGMNIDF